MDSPTTLRMMVSQVRRMLERGDVPRDTSFDEREIAKVIRDNAHYQLKGEWFELKKAGYNVVDSHYVAQFDNVAVKEDPDTYLCYSDLPAEYVALPEGLGIQRVAPMPSYRNQNPDAFIPIPPNFEDIWGNLPAGMMEHQFGFKPARGKIIYTRKGQHSPLGDGIKKVSVSLVIISPEDISMDAHFPAPPEIRNTIIQQTLEMFGIRMTESRDNLNNNNPEI